MHKKTKRKQIYSSRFARKGKTTKLHSLQGEGEERESGERVCWVFLFLFYSLFFCSTKFISHSIYVFRVCGLISFSFLVNAYLCELFCVWMDLCFVVVVRSADGLIYIIIYIPNSTTYSYSIPEMIPYMTAICVFNVYKKCGSNSLRFG